MKATHVIMVKTPSMPGPAFHYVCAEHLQLTLGGSVHKLSPNEVTLCQMCAPIKGGAK